MTKTLYLIFTLLLLGGFAVQAAEVSKSSYKYKNAHRVFKHLKTAIGHTDKGEPEFKMVNTQYCVARMNFQEGVIELEEKAYDICQSFGIDSLNALAVLIGHELTHYYLDHDWHNEHGSSYASEDMGHEMHHNGMPVKSLEHMESEADQYGGVYGYLAGYNTLGIGPELLERVYEQYDLDHEMEGYPSLNQRKRIAHDAQLKLQDLIPVFDAANYLTAMGEHKKAAKCYRHIMSEFPSREIMNNAAVALASASLQYFDPKDVSYDFPFELDANTRLSTGLKAPDNNVATRNQLLREAAHLLQDAINADPHYVVAHFNLALVQHLRDDVQSSHSLLSTAGKMVHNKEQEAKLFICKAILADREGKASMAMDFVDKAISLNPSHCARNNQKLLKGQNIRPIPGSMGFAAKAESIKGKKIADIYQLFQDSNEHSTQYLDADTKLHIREVDCSKVVWLEEDEHLIMLQTNPNYQGQSARNISVGDHARELQEVYGMPNRMLHARSGVFMVYDKAKIAFFVSSNNRVDGWMIWDRY